MEYTKPQNAAMGEVFGALLGKCIGVMSGDNWKTKRGYFDPLFKPDNVERNKSYIAQRIASALAAQQTLSACDSGTPIKPQAVLKSLPLMISARCIYGPLLRDSDELPLLDMINCHDAVMLSVFQDRFVRMPFYRRFPTTVNRTIDRFTQLWRQYNRDVISRLETEDMSGWSSEDNKAATMFATLVQHLHSGDLTETEYVHTLDEIIMTNVDVTTAVMSWVWIYLAAYPAVQERLRAEINSQEDPLGEYVARKGTFLECVLNEIMRLQPLVAMTFPDVLDKDAELGGYVIPKGVSLNSRFITPVQHNAVCLLT
jgi:gliotoxin/aspirochlorine/mycotoxins biosynthesis cytochrome P450 monooxygenase